jgi:hypothetical protein
VWLHAPNITCTHAFSTRHGGISPVPFNSLNLGGSEDEPKNISANRQLAFEALDLSLDQLCNLKQVHGTTVCNAKPGIQEGDALVTNTKELVLAVSIADCYPILFHDPINNVIGAAHAGWRGTVGKIASKTIEAMVQLGALPKNIQVAIGQGISTDKFEVGAEVIDQFRNAGFPKECIEANHIDLVKSNRFVLEGAGIPPQNIWVMNRCTFEDDFFSYRRDKGVTGRMWGLISMSSK